MIAIFLVILGIGSRLVVHTPQFTSILAVAMFGGLYLSRRQALLLPLLLMVVTDLVLGFHDTMVFTWGSMLLVSLIGIWLRPYKNFATVLAGSIISAGLFFVVTNFGAWLSPLYPHTWSGLRECYTMAIPFFRSTLVSTVAYSMVLYAGYEWYLKRLSVSPAIPASK
jgi:hypothetical protein